MLMKIKNDSPAIFIFIHETIYNYKPSFKFYLIEI